MVVWIFTSKQITKYSLNTFLKTNIKLPLSQTANSTPVLKPPCLESTKEGEAHSEPSSLRKPLMYVVQLLKEALIGSEIVKSSQEKGTELKIPKILHKTKC